MGVGSLTRSAMAFPFYVVHHSMVSRQQYRAMQEHRTRLALLGRFKIINPPSSVQNLNIKQKALIAYLAAHPSKEVPRDQLADLIWEHASAKNARHSLSQAIYGISKVLPG